MPAHEKVVFSPLTGLQYSKRLGKKPVLEQAKAAVNAENVWPCLLIHGLIKRVFLNTCHDQGKLAQVSGFKT